MKNFVFILMTALLLFSCKSKEDKINDFVAMYNRSSGMINNPMISSTKAEKSADGVIDITINTTLQKDALETQLVGSSIPDLIGKVIESDNTGKELVNEGVKFNLRIRDVNQNIISAKTLDKSNIEKSNVDLKAIGKGEKPTTSQLNELLETFNKNLPITDQATGVKILSIKADADNNIVYTNEVPDAIIPGLKTAGAEKMMKDEMLRSPEIRNILNKSSVLGVSKLRYVYNDSKGNLVKEIVITKEDLK
ncbi:hypothetical protein ASG01_11010 [Chryseobacterium sp. Leaf180]|uniref:hypothetical protein n=1 Tax=Chryseobacterium sp. Leaf180 TaxID=1736289 RepID=UPI000701DEF7|nr:hypothetical protein [Chryseobacterium sp. Leaf180]KQR92444.1 hypothetical protein ASG01_11010 [Chryseobacterium sp. Leaf180]